MFSTVTLIVIWYQNANAFAEARKLLPEEKRKELDADDDTDDDDIPEHELIAMAGKGVLDTSNVINANQRGFPSIEET